MEIRVIVAVVVGVLFVATAFTVLAQTVNKRTATPHDDADMQAVVAERNQLRRDLIEAYGPDWVAKLDEMAHWTSRRRQEEPRIEALITFVGGSVGSMEHAWGRKAIEEEKDPRYVTDTAFRTVCCVLASRLRTSPGTGQSFSLAETSDFVSGLWSRHPGAQTPLSASAVSSLIRQAEDLLANNPQSHDLFRLGELVPTNTVLSSTYAAMLVPQLAADMHGTFPFSIYASK